MDLMRVLAVARGEAPADLVLAGGTVLDVFTGELLSRDVAVVDGVVAALGRGLAGAEEVDVGGRLVLPGLIDAHVHIESSMVTPAEFARTVVPRGTTTVVCDPHEIANVAGLDGIRFMLEASEGLPLDVQVMASSCVPATHLATAGAELTASDLASLRDEPRVPGLAEVMNVPGVVLGDPEVHAKLAAFHGRVIDGHGPRLGPPWLDAYVAAGVGSDHESVTVEEAREKLRRGMRIFLRQATGAHNLVDLLPAVTAHSSRRCALCTDDRHPHDLLDEGHVDHLVRLAVGAGLDPVTAVQLATLNAAEAFRLHDRGAVAPGRRADLVVCSDLTELRADLVFSRGRLVAEAGEAVGPWSEVASDDSRVRRPVRVDAAALDLEVPAGGRRVRVIGVVPGQLVTEHLTLELPAEHGRLLPDPEQGVLKIAVAERHRGTGNLGLGFIRGLGPQRGAIASTVAHDHHNLLMAGADDASMRTAAAAVAEVGGGLAAALGERVLGVLPLPLGGLMSDRPALEVRGDLDALLSVTHEALACAVADPFMVLSFMGLEVIPALKLTDQGLVDVERFEKVGLFVG